MTKLNKRLAIICQNKQLPFIFEEAEHLGLDVTFFYNSQENCPGNLPAVDRSVPIPLFEDEEKAMNIVKQTFVESPFDGVVTLFEPALHFTAKAAAELNLPGLPLQTIENCRNKSETRRILRQHGLNIPFFQEAAAYEDLEHVQLTFPLVVKPINGFSSQGVVRADDRKQLKEAMRKAEDINKGDLSRFVTGKKASLLSNLSTALNLRLKHCQFKEKSTYCRSVIKAIVKGRFLKKASILHRLNWMRRRTIRSYGK